MSVFRKARTACRLLRDEGPGAVLDRLRRKQPGSQEAPAPLQAAATPPSESQIVFECLDAGSFHGFMIDVGAHMGSALKPFLENGWRILAFEPDSHNRERLIEFFGQSPNMRIDSRAISDEPGEDVVLYRSAESTGISGLSKFRPTHAEAETVSVTTLRDVLDEHDGETIDFLKIDAEGFDLHVLKGFPWDRGAPRAVLCEFEDSKMVPLGYTFHDMARFLQDRGYRLVVSEWHPIKRYGIAHDWRRFITYPSELADTQAWGNFIAVREEEIYKRLLGICGLDG